MADWLTELSGRLDAAAEALSASPTKDERKSAASAEADERDERTVAEILAADEGARTLPSPFGTAVRPVFDVPDAAVSCVSKAAISIQAAERGRAVRARSQRARPLTGIVPARDVAQHAPRNDSVVGEGDCSVSASWLDQSISASRSQSLPTPGIAPEYQEEAEAKLAYDRARLRNEWECLTREKAKFAAQRRDFEEMAAIVSSHGFSSEKAGMRTSRPSSAPACRTATDRSRRTRGHRTARRRAAQAAADAAYAARLDAARRSCSTDRTAQSTSQRPLSPATSKHDIGEGWQLVLSSSNISDLLIPTNRISVSYWNAEAGCTCSDPPAHIEPNLRRLLAPDRTGCVSATTVQRLVDKSASMEAVTSVAATDTSVDLTTTKKKRKKQRKKKRNSEPLLVKLQQRAERMGQLEMERSKAEWIASRPKDYLAHRSSSRRSVTSRRSLLRFSPVRTKTISEGSPRAKLDGAVHVRPELKAPAFSIVSGDWLTSSHAFPAESAQGEELLARLEARRAARTDYNTWVRDGSDPQALERLAAEVRKSQKDLQCDANTSAVNISNTLNDLEKSGYGYGEDFLMTVQGRDRVEAAKYRGTTPRGATPERLRRMIHGVHTGKPSEDGVGEVDGITHRTQELPGSHGLQVGDEHENDEHARMHMATEVTSTATGPAAPEDGEGDATDYRAELQTVLPSSKAATDNHREISVMELDEASPPIPGETDFEAQLRRRKARVRLEEKRDRVRQQEEQAREQRRRQKAAAEAQCEAVFEAVRTDDVSALSGLISESGSEVLYVRDRTGMTPLEMAVSLKKTGACGLLVDVADTADLEAETEGRSSTGRGGHVPSPGARRRGVLGARLKSLRKAASEIGTFKAEVGMELRAKKRPLGHRNMVADKYYPCVVVGVNGDGSLRVRYPDEGRRGIEDDALTVDHVDLSSVPKNGRSGRAKARLEESVDRERDSLRDALADIF